MRTQKELEYLIMVKALRARRDALLTELKTDWRGLKRRFNVTNKALIDSQLHELLMFPQTIRIILLAMLSSEEYSMTEFEGKATDRWARYVTRASRLRHHVIAMRISRRISR